LRSIRAAASRRGRHRGPGQRSAARTAGRVWSPLHGRRGHLRTGRSIQEDWLAAGITRDVALLEPAVQSRPTRTARAGDVAAAGRLAAWPAGAGPWLRPGGRVGRLEHTHAAADGREPGGRGAFG